MGSVGNKHVCLHNFQRVYCWGAGRYLGTGFGINVGDTQPAVSGDSFTQEHSGKTILGISAQGESTCLYYSDGNGQVLGEMGDISEMDVSMTREIIIVS